LRQQEFEKSGRNRTGSGRARGASGAAWHKLCWDKAATVAEDRMEIYAALAARAGNPPARRATGPGSGSQALLLSESPALLGGPRPLFETLSLHEREMVLGHGRRRVVHRGQTLFSQGTPHDGIYLIESGRIRVFYMAPSGREITLAYWYPGNFVGGPEIFGPGLHQWSGVATSTSSVVQFPGRTLRALVQQIPNLAIGLIEGLTFKGKCYSALAQMLGTRSVTERLAHLLLHLVDAYGIKDRDGILIGAAFTHADLAHMVGSTRQWVTISLKRLQDQGVVTTRKSQIVVRRLDALVEMRGGES
jgi:CRP/FNR family cyclic AMP-dependent transcriptional regulator